MDTSNVLFHGDLDAVREWGKAQATRGVSCHEVLAGTSPVKARAFAQAALQVVHSALRVVTATRPVSALESAYLTKHLHDAVAVSVVSPWTSVDDDCRGAVALEVAQRCRTAPFLRGALSPLKLPASTVQMRGGQSRPTALPHLLAFLEGVVLEDLATDPLQDEYLSKVKRLQAGFGLTTEELRKLLGVSRAAIHKWMEGHGISREVKARIDEWLEILVRMESYWRPGRLPSIMRRRARGLKGQTALSLLLRGQAGRVLTYFEALTDYSGTA